MEALADGEQAKYVGYRATAYKLATLLVKGPGLALAGFCWLLPRLCGDGRAAPGARALASGAPAGSRKAGAGLFGRAADLRWQADGGGGAVAVAAIVADGVSAPGALRSVVSGPVPLSFWAALGILLVLGIVALRARASRASGRAAGFGGAHGHPEDRHRARVRRVLRTGELVLAEDESGRSCIRDSASRWASTRC